MRPPPGPLTLGGRRIVLGWARVGEATEELLSARELALLGPRTVAPRRAQFVAGRLAARRALEALGLTGEVLRTLPPAEDAGRPLLAVRGGPWPPELAVSLSHSGILACAAVGEGSAPIGLDLEAAALESSPAFLDEAFAPQELEAFSPFGAHGLDPLRAAWTLKEAVLKVWGVGLRVPLTRLHLKPEALERLDGWVACRVSTTFSGAGPKPPPRMVARVGEVEGAVIALALTG